MAFQVMSEPKIKICSICQTEFRPFKTTQKVCSMDCAIQLMKTKNKQNEFKAVRARQKVLRDKWQTDTVQL